MLKGKKIFSILLAVMVCVAMMPAAVFADEVTGVEINNTNFPDAGFREYIRDEIDRNGDGTLSDAEINRVKKIDFGDEAKNLKGIEIFKNLEVLDCETVGLTSLDVSKNTKLKKLICMNNKLTKLDVSKNKNLTYLDCEYNRLTKLNVSKNTKLKTFACSSNKITKLSVSKNKALTGLYCSDNKLKTLNVSKHSKLKEVYCGSNRISKLNVSKCKSLKVLNCYDNKLKKLNVKNHKYLKDLWVNLNKIKTVNVKGCSKKIEVYTDKKTKVTGKKLKRKPIYAIYVWANHKVKDRR